MFSYKAYLPFAHPGAVALAQLRHVGAGQAVSALRWVVQQAEYVEQGRLAAARRAHDGHELALVDVNVHMV